MNKVPYDLPTDNKAQRLKRRYQGLSRVAAAINDLYIYGVYPSNFPNLTTVLEQAKDHCKEIIKETKAEIAFIENPNGCLLYTSPSPRDKRQSRMPSSA